MNNLSPDTSQTRRDFLQTAAILTAGGSLIHPTSLTAQETSAVDTSTEIGIVDTHQHLWDLDKLNLPWLGGAPETLKRSFVMSDYLQATANVNIAKSIYMEVNVADDEKEKEADHVVAERDGGVVMHPRRIHQRA